MYKIGIVGFGTVGQGIGRLLFEKKNSLKEKYSFEYKVVGIADPVKGMIYNDRGIDLGKALEFAKQGKRLEEGGLGESGWDSLKLIKEGNLDILLEITPTNLKNGEPGITHIKEALKRGIHVATTNKGPIALYYRELMRLAEENRALLRFEGTVLSGTPVINMALKDLAGAEITEIKGIVNGTTNYILTEMSRGKTYEEALKEAQSKGYAETDPTADVEGYDALAKALILANVVLSGNLKPEDAEREGITKLTTEDIAKASKENKKWKLIAKTWKENNTVYAKVKPELVGPEDPLYHIDGVLNAVTFKTDVLGEVTIIGPGAGSIEAGYALLTDVLDIHRTLKGEG